MLVEITFHTRIAGSVGLRSGEAPSTPCTIIKAIRALNLADSVTDEGLIMEAARIALEYPYKDQPALDRPKLIAVKRLENL